MPNLLRERQRQKARVTGDDFGTSADGYVALDGDERALDARRRRRVGVQTRALAVQGVKSQALELEGPELAAGRAVETADVELRVDGAE